MKSKLGASLQFILIASAIFSGCEEPKKHPIADKNETRKGERLVTAGLRYYDGKPSMSADGSRVAFVSGRGIAEDSGSLPYLRVFSSEFAIGAATTESARVTSDKIEASEIAVEVSPDGTHAAILTRDEVQTDMQLFNFHETGVKITDSTDTERGARFSADSKLLAWTTIVESTDGTADKSSISLIEVAKPEVIYTFKQDSGDVNFEFWLPVGSGYKMVFSVPGKDDQTLNSATFLTASVFSTATVASWTTAAKLAGLTHASVGRDFVALGKSLADGERTVPTFGDADTAAAEVVNVSSAPALLDQVGTLKVDTNFATGHNFEFAALSTATDFGLFASQIRIHCKDENATYATGLFLYRGPQADVTALVPISDDKSVPTTVTDSYCQRTISDGVQGQLDKRISFAQLNSGASPDKFRLVYETTEGGDSEVRFIDSVGDTRTVKEFSVNKTQ